MALIVFVTIPPKNAETLAKKILHKRLCACVNILHNVTSYFWWENKVQKEKESLLVIKTKNTLYPQLQKAIKKYHPYTVPEIIAVHIDKINKEYLQWLTKETRA